MSEEVRDMGPSRPAALDERWKPIAMTRTFVKRMEESHWCAGWDCSTCIWIRTTLDLYAEQDRLTTSNEALLTLLSKRSEEA